jgi:hypothetical protein
MLPAAQALELPTYYDRQYKDAGRSECGRIYKPYYTLAAESGLFGFVLGDVPTLGLWVFL